MRVLITGYCGFVGPFLAEGCLAQGDEVFGSTFLSLERRRRQWGSLDALAPTRRCDFTKPAEVAELVRWAKPERIFHLVAQSHVPTSFKNPELTCAINIDGASSLLDAAREQAAATGPPRLLFIGSGQQYGQADKRDLPLTETAPLNPPNPYAASKCEQEDLALSSGLPVHCARAFNHIGPGQSPDFAVAAFARQLAQIKLGRRENVVRTGNLDVWRDFTDVRDVVRAYLDIIELEPAGEIFNVASGRETRLGDILQMLIEIAEVEVEVIRDPELFRPVDQPHNYGDCRKLHKRTGWQPEISLAQSLSDVFEDWLAQEQEPPAQEQEGLAQE